MSNLEVCDCNIDIYIDPKIKDMMFSVRYMNNLFSIKFVIHDKMYIVDVAKKLEDLLKFNHQYNVKINSCPKSIVENTEFFQIINRVCVPFAPDNLENSTIDQQIVMLQRHTKEYGAHPNFTDTRTVKNRNKIWNYIKTALAEPLLSLDDALYIAKFL